MKNTRQTMFIGAMFLAAAASTAYSAMASHALHGYLTAAVLVLAVVTSRMKIKLPGLEGNMSVNLPFLLTAIVSLSAAEAVAITLLSTVAQGWPQKGKFKPEQMFFNLSMMSFASSFASLTFHSQRLQAMLGHSTPLGIALAAAMLFLGQTAPVAGIIAVSEGKNVGPIWYNMAQLTFPYFVVGAGVSSMVQNVSAHLGWQLALGVFPAMYGIRCSYLLYFSRMAESNENPQVQSQPIARTAKAGA